MDVPGKAGHRYPSSCAACTLVRASGGCVCLPVVRYIRSPRGTGHRSAVLAMRLATQITPFGCGTGSRACHQLAAPNGGSCI